MLKKLKRNWNEHLKSICDRFNIKEKRFQLLPETKIERHLSWLWFSLENNAQYIQNNNHH